MNEGETVSALHRESFPGGAIERIDSPRHHGMRGEITKGELVTTFFDEPDRRERGDLPKQYTRRRTLSSIARSITEEGDALEEAMQPAYFNTYDGLAKSLALMDPILSLYSEKLHLSVKMMYADRKNELRTMSLRALLVDVLDSTVRLDRAHHHKKRPGARRSEPALVTPPVASPPPSTDQRRAITELRQRDLRRLESMGSNEEPYVLVRRHAVLMSMGPLVRAIIQFDRLILIVHQDPGNDEVLNQLERHIDGWLRAERPSVPVLTTPRLSTMVTTPAESLEALAHQLPFDCRAYEALFTVLLSLLRSEYERLEAKTDDVINAIGRHSLLSLRLQEALQSVKQQNHDLEQQIRGHVRVLESIVQVDEDQFAFLKLHALADDPTLYNLPLSEGVEALNGKGSDLETLLDTSLIDFQALQKLIASNGNRIAATEQAVLLRLDTSRNELLVASTILSVVSCTVGFGAFVTGAFGMNLDNTDSLQPVRGLFYGVCVSCLCAMVLLTMGTVYFFRRHGILPTHGYVGKRAQLGS